MNIQWFPGHMAKTRKQISDDLKLVDILYELVDARLPFSSRNPEIDQIAGSKPRILILNKADLSDPVVNRQWISHFQSKKIPAVAVSCTNNIGIHQLTSQTYALLENKIAHQKHRGMVGAGIKVMIVGIPNVGKSTLINCFAGKARAKTGDRPGVTKGKQWVLSQNRKLQFLDTPGILWPKFESQDVGLKLAFSGAVKDEVMDIEELAVSFISYMQEFYPSLLLSRYRMDAFSETSYGTLEMIGRKRGCIMSGGEVDTHKAAVILFDEFRAGKLGNISLEAPEDLISGIRN